jgi:hypothetical protein
MTLLQIDKMFSLKKHQVVKTVSGQNVNSTKCFGTKFYFLIFFRIANKRQSQGDQKIRKKIAKFFQK